MIPFNKPAYLGTENQYIQKAFTDGKLSGDGQFTQMCSKWLEHDTSSKKALLTTSATHALEMAAILCNIMPGDEVIMPSFTFASTANAFVLRGAKIVFVDIRPDTMNIDETLIEAAITSKTKAIVPVHYAGISCEMDTIMAIAARHKLYVVEDAAQGIGSTYKGKKLGSIGHLGCYSFHETKNISCGEGGALLINDESLIERGEIIREKGTNRSRFWRGEVDKYTWMDIGSSYLLSEINAACLFAQLEQCEKINSNRANSFELYNNTLKTLADKGYIELPFIPDDCTNNGHMFYIKCKDIAERTALIEYLKDNEIQTVFHYNPLHSSPAGLLYSIFFKKDVYTTAESQRLLRLPMFYNMKPDNIRYICIKIAEFYSF